MVEAEDGGRQRARISIRRRRDEDIPALTALRNLPRVRWGTLSMPYTSVSFMARRLNASKDDVTSLVACVGETVVGEAAVVRKTMPRIAPGASIGVMVHDDWQHCGVGTALFAALLDLADNWLGLRRLELSVYVDNAPAIALYRKFGFEIEGVEVADAFRDGVFVDSYFMARLQGDLPPDRSAAPALPPPAAVAPFYLRASEPDDLAGIAALMAQPIVRHGTLRLPFAAEEESRGLAEPDGTARAIVAEAAGEIVGIGCLKPAVNRRAHCADVAVLAVHEAWQRRGVGSALLAALLDIADNWLNLKRLHLTVLADNEPAIALYGRFGFVEEVTKRADIFRAGGFADSRIMARLR